MDEANEAISDVTITIGSASTLTDENGNFTLKNIDIKERGSFLKASKEGYFHNSSFVTSKLNSDNYIPMTLLEKKSFIAVDSDNGGSASFPSGAKLDFPPAAFTTLSGEPYTGSVNVYSTWLDPTSPDLVNMMPGDLRAINVNQDNRLLESYSMIGVELESESGAQLKVKEGVNVMVTFPIPSDLISSAPENIPTWHFDEDTGFWMEEGSATKQGNVYIGEVSHFTFWNCDIPKTFVFLDGFIKQRGIGMPFVKVKITSLDDASCAVGHTNSEGLYSGLIPDNELLKIEVYDDCDGIVYSAEIGPFTEDVTLQDIDLILDNASYITYNGILQDCDGNPVQDGYVFFSSNTISTTVEVQTDGTFEASIFKCEGDQISIFGYDRTANQSTNVTTILFTNLDIFDLGILNTCDGGGDVFEFVHFSIGNNNFVILEPNPRAFLYSQFNVLELEAWNTANGIPSDVCNFTITNFTGLGQYDAELLILQVIVDGEFIVLECDNCSDVKVDITFIGSTGGFVKGNFSGNIIKNNVTYQVSGEFAAIIE